MSDDMEKRPLWSDNHKCETDSFNEFDRYTVTYNLSEDIRCLKEQLEQQAKSIAELKKKRSKGEINEAYAKTIEANKIEISGLKVKLNKLTQKAEKQAKSIDELESAICVWSREELGAMPFEGDREAIEHFVSYWTNERFN